MRKCKDLYLSTNRTHLLLQYVCVLRGKHACVPVKTKKGRGWQAVQDVESNA